MIASRSTLRLAIGAPSRRAQERRTCHVVRASQREDGIHLGRRSALIAGGLLASPVAIPGAVLAEGAEFVLEPAKLSAAQARAQRDEVEERSLRALAPVLKAADAPLAFRLVFNDAGTYDYSTRSGGMDGSIVLGEELSRSENEILKPLVAKLKDVKSTIDTQNAENNQGPISWADLLVLTARLAVSKAWRVEKRKRTSSDEDAAFLDTAFGANWPIRLGRQDSNTPGGAGRIPQSDASVEDIRTFLLQLGAKPDGGTFYKPPFYERPGFVLYTAAQPDPAKAEEFLATDPEFAKWKENYDKSRRTITRTNYEVDFITYFTRLTDLGAKFDKLAYLRPVAVALKKF